MISRNKGVFSVIHCFINSRHQDFNRNSKCPLTFLEDSIPLDVFQIGHFCTAKMTKKKQFCGVSECEVLWGAVCTSPQSVILALRYSVGRPACGLFASTEGAGRFLYNGQL